MDDLSQKIRDRAYEIWTDEGRPSGLEAEHWERARIEVEGAAGETASEDERLDGALEDTFPTSEPPSESQPGGGITGPGDAR